MTKPTAAQTVFAYAASGMMALSAAGCASAPPPKPTTPDETAKFLATMEQAKKATANIESGLNSAMQLLKSLGVDIADKMPPPAAAPDAPLSASPFMQDATDATFSDMVLKRKGLVLVDVWDASSRKSQELGLDALAERDKDKIAVVRMRYMDNLNTVVAQGFSDANGSMALPGLFVFNNGHRVAQIVPSEPVQIAQDVEDVIAKFPPPKRAPAAALK